MRDETLVHCLLKLAIAFQALPVFLPRTTLVKVEGVEMVMKVVCCVEYFISYELCSVITVELTSINVRFAFNNSLIEVIKILNLIV